MPDGWSCPDCSSLRASLNIAEGEVRCLTSENEKQRNWIKFVFSPFLDAAIKDAGDLHNAIIVLLANLDSDDWKPAEDIVQAIKKHSDLIAEYKRILGTEPFSEPPLISPPEND